MMMMMMMMMMIAIIHAGYLRTLSVSRLCSAGWWDDDEWKYIRKEAVVAYSRYYPRIFLERLTKTPKGLSQDSW
jgi:hypothetical protein